MKMSKQDIMIRMSIDPNWTIENPESPLIKEAEKNGFDNLLEINQDSLNVERKGRWKQILKTLEPIYVETLKILKEENCESEFIFSDIFPGYLSSENLWDVNQSMEHPAGFGKGREKATSFYNYLCTLNIPIFVKEVASVEYARFVSIYKLSNYNLNNLDEKIYLQRNVSLISTTHDVLNLIENNNVEKPEKKKQYYVISSIGKIYRINQETYDILGKFRKGMFLDKNNNLEKGVIEQASQINLLTNNISTTNDSKLIELLGN